MQHPAEHRFPDAHALANALSGEIRVDLQEAIAERGAAGLVVSGGRTPVALFNHLSAESLDWSRVFVTLVDERWVDVKDTNSNECMVRSQLLHGAARAAHFIGLKNAAATPAEGVTWTWRSLVRVIRPFDVVVLGMGDDGHTASLFPMSPGLSDALDASRPPACVAMKAPVAPEHRISMNLSALLDARRIIVQIHGATKWSVYQRAKERGSVAELPIRAVLHQQSVPVEIFWSP
jgi:6-phosphogluconolactonase